MSCWPGCGRGLVVVTGGGTEERCSAFFSLILSFFFFLSLCLTELSFAAFNFPSFPSAGCDGRWRIWWVRFSWINCLQCLSYLLDLDVFFLVGFTNILEKSTQLSWWGVILLFTERKRTSGEFTIVGMLVLLQGCISAKWYMLQMARTLSSVMLCSQNTSRWTASVNMSVSKNTVYGYHDISSEE